MNTNNNGLIIVGGTKHGTRKTLSVRDDSCRCAGFTGMHGRRMPERGNGNAVSGPRNKGRDDDNSDGNSNNGTHSRAVVGLSLLSLVIFAAGVEGIRELPLPDAMCGFGSGLWAVGTLLPLIRRFFQIPPAEGQGETIMRERFQVIQGGRTVLPTADDRALQNYIENYSTARNPEIAKVINIEIARRKAQGTWMRSARRLREERAA